MRSRGGLGASSTLAEGPILFLSDQIVPSWRLEQGRWRAFPPAARYVLGMSLLANLFRSKRPNRDRVLPLVRGAAAGGADVPTLELSGEEAPLLEVLAPRLYLTYATEHSDAFVFLDEADRARLRLPAEELRRVAIANLRRRVKKPARSGAHGLFTLRTDQHLDASLLLLDEVWEAEADTVRGDLVVAVPSRDVIAFSGTAESAIDRLEGLVDEIWRGGEHPLSPDLYVRTGGRWTLHDPGARYSRRFDPSGCGALAVAVGALAGSGEGPLFEQQAAARAWRDEVARQLGVELAWDESDPTSARLPLEWSALGALLLHAAYDDRGEGAPPSLLPSAWSSDAVLIAASGDCERTYPHLLGRVDAWLPGRFQPFQCPSFDGAVTTFGSIDGLLEDLRALDATTWRADPAEARRWSALELGATLQEDAKIGYARLLAAALVAEAQRLPMRLDPGARAPGPAR